MILFYCNYIIYHIFNKKKINNLKYLMDKNNHIIHHRKLNISKIGIKELPKKFTETKNPFIILEK